MQRRNYTWYIFNELRQKLCYNNNKIIKIKSVAKEFSFLNPSPLLIIDITDLGPSCDHICDENCWYFQEQYMMIYETLGKYFEREANYANVEPTPRYANMTQQQPTTTNVEASYDYVN